MPKDYSKRIWTKIVNGKSQSEIIKNGVPEKAVNKFFKEWNWKIEQLHSIQKAALQELLTSTLEKHENPEAYKTSDDIFTCERCGMHIRRDRIKDHINEQHPQAPPPSMNASEGEWQNFYYDTYRGHAQYKCVDNRLIYTPMRK